jgi:hypothetical protein
MAHWERAGAKDVFAAIEDADGFGAAVDVALLRKAKLLREIHKIFVLFVNHRRSCVDRVPAKVQRPGPPTNLTAALKHRHGKPVRPQLLQEVRQRSPTNTRSNNCHSHLRCLLRRCAQNKEQTKQQMQHPKWVCSNEWSK